MHILCNIGRTQLLLTVDTISRRGSIEILESRNIKNSSKGGERFTFQNIRGYSV